MHDQFCRSVQDLFQFLCCRDWHLTKHKFTCINVFRCELLINQYCGVGISNTDQLLSSSRQVRVNKVHSFKERAEDLKIDIQIIKSPTQNIFLFQFIFIFRSIIELTTGWETRGESVSSAQTNIKLSSFYYCSLWGYFWDNFAPGLRLSITLLSCEGCYPTCHEF